MFSVPIAVVSVKDRSLWEMKLFLFKNHIFDPKMHYNHVSMCSDNVFTIIVSDVFKLIENFKSYNFFPQISLRKFSKSS